jgi:predicted nucleic acid-binding Zn ribbon protein
MKATRKCSFCGKSFVTRSGMQRYCSEACQAEAKRARVMQKNNLFKITIEQPKLIRNIRV